LENVILTTNEIPAHSHVAMKRGELGGGQKCTSYTAGLDTSLGLGNNYTDVRSEDTGEDGAHENMPPYIVVNYIIKY